MSFSHWKWYPTFIAAYYEALANINITQVNKEWCRQAYGIDNYKDSAIGLAGAVILKIASDKRVEVPKPVTRLKSHSQKFRPSKIGKRLYSMV